MRVKQDLSKRLTIILGVGVIAMSFALIPNESDKQKETKVVYPKNKDAERILNNVVMKGGKVDRNVKYMEYSYTDVSLEREIICYIPISENLKPIIEIHNLKTGDIFHDYGLDGFNGEIDDNFYSKDKDFVSNPDTLNSSYKKELKEILS